MKNVTNMEKCEKCDYWKIHFWIIGGLACSWLNPELNSVLNPLFNVTSGLTTRKLWDFNIFANFSRDFRHFFCLLGHYIAWGDFPDLLLSLPYRFETWFSFFFLLFSLPVVRPCFDMGIAYVFSIGLFGPCRLCLYSRFVL